MILGIVPDDTYASALGVAPMRHRYLFIVGLVFAINGCASKSGPANAPSNQNVDEAGRAVRDVISKILKVDHSAIRMDKPLSDPPLKADDLDLVEIVLELEDHLGIEISDAALERYAGAVSGKGPPRITPNQLASIVRDAPKKKMNRSRPNH